MEICPRCRTVFARPGDAGPTVLCPRCAERWPGGFPPYEPADLPPLEVVIEPWTEPDRTTPPVAWRLRPDAPVTLGREHAGDGAYISHPRDSSPRAAPEAPPRLALPDPSRLISRAHAVFQFSRRAATSPTTRSGIDGNSSSNAGQLDTHKHSDDEQKYIIDDPRQWLLTVRDLGGANGTWTAVAGDPPIVTERPFDVSVLLAPTVYLGGAAGVGVPVSVRARVAIQPESDTERPPPPALPPKEVEGRTTLPWQRAAMPTVALMVRATDDALAAPTANGAANPADQGQSAALTEWRAKVAGACWLRPLAPGSISHQLWLNGHRLFGTTPAYPGDRLQCGHALYEVRADGLAPMAPRSGLSVKVNLDCFRFGGKSGNSSGGAGLRNIKVTLESNNFIGLLGPSGCGKTTLLNLLAARLDAAGTDAGARWISIIDNDPTSLFSPIGTDSAAVAAYRARTAVVPQEDTLHPELTPREELRYAAKLRKVPSSKERIEYLGRSLRLTDGATKGRTRFDRPIAKLSGGERKRVNIALGLLGQPRLLLLDEPTAALDPATERRVMAHLRRLADQGHTVVCATHVLQNALLFDMLIVMRVDRSPDGARWGTVDFAGAPAAALAHYRAREIGEIYARLEQ